MAPVHSAREVAIGGLFLALALALPPLFHLMGLGSVFLPMLLPVISVGFLTSWRIAVTVGFLAPLISGMITGMPPFVPPIAFMMMVELSMLGLIPSLLYRTLRWNFWIVLVLTLVINRGVVFLLRFVVAEFFSIPGIAYSLATVTAGLPGIALMLIAVPLIVKTIERGTAGRR
ncbi:MAG: ECF transporter S component [Candidatus Eisenbacteria bacterium]|jgi:hypothetical protein|nr:ECF transporter S component [Candidatus Eisenbacteria bacterium]